MKRRSSGGEGCKAINVENSRRFHILNMVGTLIAHGEGKFGLKTVARLSSIVSEELGHV